MENDLLHGLTNIVERVISNLLAQVIYRWWQHRRAEQIREEEDTDAANKPPV